MAITPNYKRFVPLQMNQQKKVEAKPTEDTSSTQTSINTNASSNTNSNSKIGRGTLIGQKIGSTNLIDIFEMQQQITELSKKKGTIIARLSEINLQISELQKNNTSYESDNQVNIQLEDLLTEKEELEKELKQINNEILTLNMEISSLKQSNRALIDCDENFNWNME